MHNMPGIQGQTHLIKIIFFACHKSKTIGIANQEGFTTKNRPDYKAAEEMG